MATSSETITLEFLASQFGHTRLQTFPVIGVKLRGGDTAVFVTFVPDEVDALGVRKAVEAVVDIDRWEQVRRPELSGRALLGYKSLLRPAVSGASANITSKDLSEDCLHERTAYAPYVRRCLDCPAKWIELASE